jgi:hypothetical protein
MGRQKITAPTEHQVEEYREPELVVHGDVGRITTGAAPGTADVGAQPGSGLPDDANPG